MGWRFQVFLQEKIRWMTFQVGATVLVQTLLAYCFPCLTLGRFVGLVRGRREVGLLAIFSWATIYQTSGDLHRGRVLRERKGKLNTTLHPADPLATRFLLQRKSDSRHGRSSADPSPLGSSSNGGRMLEIEQEGGRLVTPLTFRLPPNEDLSEVDTGGIIHRQHELEDLSRKVSICLSIVHEIFRFTVCLNRVIYILYIYRESRNDSHKIGMCWATYIRTLLANDHFLFQTLWWTASIPWYA